MKWAHLEPVIASDRYRSRPVNAGEMLMKRDGRGRMRGPRSQRTCSAHTARAAESGVAESVRSGAAVRMVAVAPLWASL